MSSHASAAEFGFPAGRFEEEKEQVLPAAALRSAADVEAAPGKASPRPGGGVGLAEAAPAAAKTVDVPPDSLVRIPGLVRPLSADRAGGGAKQAKQPLDLPLREDAAGGSSTGPSAAASSSAAAQDDTGAATAPPAGDLARADQALEETVRRTEILAERRAMVQRELDQRQNALAEARRRLAIEQTANEEEQTAQKEAHQRELAELRQATLEAQERAQERERQASSRVAERRLELALEETTLRVALDAERARCEKLEAETAHLRNVLVAAHVVAAPLPGLPPAPTQGGGGKCGRRGVAVTGGGPREGGGGVTGGSEEKEIWPGGGSACSHEGRVWGGFREAPPRDARSAEERGELAALRAQLAAVKERFQVLDGRQAGLARTVQKVGQAVLQATEETGIMQEEEEQEGERVVEPPRPPQFLPPQRQGFGRRTPPPQGFVVAPPWRPATLSEDGREETAAETSCCGRGEGGRPPEMSSSVDDHQDVLLVSRTRARHDDEAAPCKPEVEAAAVAAGTA